MSAAFRTTRLPWILLGVTVALVAMMVALSAGHEPVWDTVFYGLLALTIAITGAFVASRQPANAIGWLFCALGVWGGLVETWEAFAYHSLPTGAAGTWVIGWSWILDGAAYIALFLLFPTGRLLSPPWRPVVWLLAAACALAIPGQALNADNPENPLPVDALAVEIMFATGMALLIAAALAAFASLAIRFRRAEGIERLQLKQLVFAAALVIPTWAVAVPFYYESVVVQAAVGLALLGLPVAAGLAILRYRLYDIDVVINRALVYSALTVALAAAYVGSVLLLQLILSPGSDLAIAGSTLAVAGLFHPLRTRIQALVDRRFFRRRYDAVHTVEAFSARVRDEVELGALAEELRGTVADTMQPAHVSLWLREAGR